MNVRIRRRAAWMSLACYVLAQLVAGAWHQHVHPEHAARAAEAHEHPAHSHACHAGHPQADEEESPCPEHESGDEHDCSICQFLAIKWLPAAVAAVAPRLELVTFYRPALPQRPFQAPQSTHFCRGPPSA
jgi:hypothetical protein